jgi:hypothetical protein
VNTPIDTPFGIPIIRRRRGHNRGVDGTRQNEYYSFFVGNYYYYYVMVHAENKNIIIIIIVVVQDDNSTRLRLFFAPKGSNNGDNYNYTV